MNFTKLIEQLKDAFAKAYKALYEEMRRHEKAEATHRSHAAKWTAKAMQDEAKEIKAEHAKNHKAILAVLNQEKEAITKEFEKEVLTAYQPTGAAINEDDVLLLQSGIILSSNEIDNLVNKYINNTTMLRIVENYVEQNGIAVSSKAKQKFLHANSEGEFEKQAFADFVFNAEHQIGLMQYTSAGNDIFDKCNARLEEYCNTFKTKMHLNKEGESNV